MQTKYSLEDEVYLLVNNKIIEGRIFAIRCVQIDKEYMTYHFNSVFVDDNVVSLMGFPTEEYGISYNNTYSFYGVGVLFGSREELLAYIQG